MKMVIAIVQDEDAPHLISTLMSEGFSVTKLATTGGFLRAGNTTLLAGVEEDRVPTYLAIIEKLCKSRRHITASPMTIPGSATGMIPQVPIEVTIGGATVFILNVEQFCKY